MVYAVLQIKSMSIIYAHQVNKNFSNNKTERTFSPKLPDKTFRDELYRVVIFPGFFPTGKFPGNCQKVIPGKLCPIPGKSRSKLTTDLTKNHFFSEKSLLPSL